MSDKLRDEIWKTIYQYGITDKDDFSEKAIADLIISLPEIKEMFQIKKHYEALKDAFPEYAFSSNPVGPFQEWKEKAGKWDNAITSYGEKNIDSLGRMARESLGYKLITGGLVVEEKCPKCQGTKYVEIPSSDEWLGSSQIFCDYCQVKGITTGYTTRPATAEEVRELIEYAFATPPFFLLLFQLAIREYKDERGWYFLLKSGGKMRMDK